MCILVPGSGFRVGDGGLAAAAAAAVAAEGQDVWFCSASAKSPQCTDGAWGTASEKRAKSNVVTSRGEQRRWLCERPQQNRNSFDYSCHENISGGKSLVVKREKRSRQRRHGLNNFINNNNQKARFNKP